MKSRFILFVTILMLGTFYSQAQDGKDKHGFERECFIGGSAFMVLTPLLDPSPEYYQLNLGYRFSSKDEISIEGITWTYQGPIGRPYGPDYEQESTGFPGDVKAIGVGLAYKRLIWKGVFLQVHSTAFKQKFRDVNKKEIQSGFQLFNTFRVGYHIKLGKNKRWFLSPSIAMTSWPINTNLPEDFQIEEDKYPNYFLFEPGLHFGYTF